MNRRLLRVLVMVAVIGAAARVGKSLIMFHGSGIWPKDWPQELEPLRTSARTIDVGTGTQERIYEIRFSDRATFEHVWPAILKVKTPGAPLRLHSIDPDTAERKHKNNSGPLVRIHVPTNGLSIMPGSDFQVSSGRRDQQALADALENGQVLKCGPPWPDSIVDEQGGLPEYVTSVRENNRIRWVAVEPGEEVRGFKNRARVDVHIYVDGEIIDLNRIPLPADTTIIDLRQQSTADGQE